MRCWVCLLRKTPTSMSVKIVQIPSRDEMGLEQQTWQTKILFGSFIMPSQSDSPDESLVSSQKPFGDPDMMSPRFRGESTLRNQLHNRSLFECFLSQSAHLGSFWITIQWEDSGICYTEIRCWKRVYLLCFKELAVLLLSELSKMLLR